MMRTPFILSLWLLALAAHAFTPELGNDKLRRLVKLPSVSFASDWTFDPERGFKVGSHDEDVAAQIAALRRELVEEAPSGDRYRRLGALYAEINDTANARNARARAVEFYRKRVEQQPDNGALLADFGQALEESGRTQEAESVLRRAVEIAPRHWRCWLALGRFLDTESRRDIFERARRPAPAGSEKPELAPDRVALARKRLEEADLCYQAAQTNAPGEGEVYFRRGLHRTLRGYLLNEIREASGDHKQETEVLSDYFSPESVADLRQASRLRPRDYHLIGNLALFEIYGLNARHGRRGPGTEGGWDALPAESQQSLRAAMTRLEDLSQDADSRTAAGALEVLGILQGPLLHERDGALASLQRALALDPSREQAWELAAGTLAKAADYEGLLNLCEDRLRRKDTARSHLLLAKAYEKLNRWGEAETEILAALNQAPNDFGANLSYAALLLRRSQEEGVLDEAGGWLQRCDKLFNALPPGQKTRPLVIDFTLLRSIHLALAGDVESSRLWAKSVVEADRDNELAREILAAIAY